MRALSLFLMVIATAVPGLHVPAARADGPGFELTPFAGYRAGGSFDVADTTDGSESSVDLENGSSWGVDLGIYRDSSSFYELLYSRQTSGLDSSDVDLAGVDVRTEYLHFGGTLLFPSDSGPTTYFSLTVGGTFLHAESGGYDSEVFPSASLGGGLRLPFGEHFAATLGARAYVTLLDSDTDIFCVSTGENAGCLLRGTGSTFWQGEAQLGLTLVF